MNYLQCKAVTIKGVPCKSPAISNKGYCAMHSDQKIIVCKQNLNSISCALKKTLPVQEKKINGLSSEKQVPTQHIIKEKSQIKKAQSDLELPLDITGYYKISKFLKNYGYKKITCEGKDYYIPPEGAPIYFFALHSGDAITNVENLCHREYYIKLKMPRDIEKNMVDRFLFREIVDFKYWTMEMKKKMKDKLKGSELYFMPFKLPKNYVGISAWYI